MPYTNTLAQMKDEYHQGCLFNNDLFKLDIQFEKDGTLICLFDCDKRYQGYAGMIHGGVVSALIDSAMTQCLFGAGYVGYTVRLNIKYVRKVKINKPLRIVVTLKDDDSKIIKELGAVVFQEEEKKVTAKSRFWLIDEEPEEE